MGAVIDLDDATKRYAATLGVGADQLTSTGRAQALVTALQEEMRGKLIDTNGAAIRQKEAIEALSAEWAR